MEGAEPEAWQKARQSLMQVAAPAFSSPLFPAAAAAAAAAQQQAASLYAYSAQG